ncbi:TcaA NTF2-like domain-containing protein [Macrococcus capreoli]|uniref:TcaA NTF2-like domain-containing protein n=1 Tax=Macrococcus capreoli TaxID=2982690 RepID=UPI003F443517
MRITKIMLALLLSFVLAACGNNAEKKQETEAAKSETSTKLKSDETKEKSTESKESKAKAKKSDAKDESKPDLKQLTQQALNDYLTAMPDAFNTRNYEAIRQYIKADSKAAQYIQSTLPTGNFDHYKIISKSIDRIDVKGDVAHAIVTRVMSSDATNGQQKRVVTVFDFMYNKATKKMELYDFNDQAIFDVNQGSTEVNQVPNTAPQKQQAKGDATTCIQTRFASSCEGVSDAQLLNAYNTLVASGEMPNATYNGCVTCTIKAAYQLQDQQAIGVAVSNLQQAVQLTTDQYRNQVEVRYPNKDIAILGAEPINGTDIQEDLGGKYYKVKAIDIRTKELLQTYKVYVQNGSIVAE